MSAKDPVYPLSGDIICALPITGGMTSAQLARHFGFQNVRKFGALLWHDLMRLQTMGLVRRIDQESPARWQSLAS